MIGWTVTSAAARLSDAVGARSGWLAPAAVARALGLAQRGSRVDDTVFARITSRRLAASSPADRKALETALGEVGSDRFVIERAASSGAPITAVAGLAAKWEGLPATAKGWIRNPAGRSAGPVKWGPNHLTQVDQTTCGAATMAMATMIADPFVALWVATGQTIASYLPIEVLRCETAKRPAHTIMERWQSLQRSIHWATTHSAIGPLPWRVDNQLRIAGVRLRGLLINDANAAELAAGLAHASAALRDGIPVPVYSGGDSRRGIQTVVPRHVVLLLGREGDELRFYEPGSGAVHKVAVDALSQPHGPVAALGNWTRVVWLVLPKPRA